uniref:Uncharacterized protein n=1 Tax=uncultured marine group II/III euryarchaeote AD1000_88_G11 TaxID=1457822 RepID=A0A075G575_9EURY|nr:hypothetical protein [uncultured marine group II/III euryarchaeote AD1000_88_G11]
MDDYNTSLLSEAKNEYCSRLLSTLTPLVAEGMRSILKEANDICITNDEADKTLMTFQNFLARVPKWNNEIIEEETSRIIAKSGCTYLEDLLVCVHITQLKALTSVRVGSVQKKIDLDIPKLQDFIHKIYIKFARKIYTNVYLFEMGVAPLTYQKNMRECEILCKESILEVIRDSIPIESILRSYIDNTEEEEIVEEVSEKIVENKELPDTSPSIGEIKDASSISVKKADEPLKEDNISVAAKEDQLPKKVEKKLEPPPEVKPDTPPEVKPGTPIKVHTEPMKEDILKKVEDKVNKDVSGNLSFSDVDTVFNKNTMEKTKVIAPKTIERLEKISAAAHQKRKEEEAGADAAEEDEEDKIKIFREGPDIKLDITDIHNIDKKLELKPPLITDIEILK